MDPSSPEAQDILRYYNVAYDEVIFYEFHHQIGKYLLLAGIIVMLWDHIMTVPDEIKYVWQVEGHWTIATALFGFNRYVSPLGFIIRFIQLLLQNSDQPMCSVGKITVYWNIVSFACVEIVLMLRVWVMYRRNQKMGLFLVTVFTTALVTSFVVPSKQLDTINDVVEPLPTSLTLCVRTAPSAYIGLIIIASLVDTIVLSLFCVRVYLSWRDSITTPVLLRALFSQGAVYYVVVFCTFIISIPGTMRNEMYLPLADSNLAILIPCVACSRLILSLRGLYYSQMVVGPTTLGTETKGEYKESIRVGATSSSGVATSLDTSMFSAHAEGNDRIRGKSGEADIGLESPAEERLDSTVLGRTTAGKGTLA